MIALLAAALASVVTTAQFTEPLRGKTLVFVGAHPDDEGSFMPIMVEACRFKAAKCHFVVASEKNSYGCLMTIGLKDPAACTERRYGEMRASAALANGTVTWFGWDDLFYAFNDAGMTRVRAQWGAKHGGDAALIDTMATTLARLKPDVIFAHDPRHGTTCHASHRVVSRLLVEALDRMPAAQRPPLWFENSNFIGDTMNDADRKAFDGGAFYAWPGEAARVTWVDIAPAMPDGRTGFAVFGAYLRAHASQYPDIVSGKQALDAPAAAQRVPLTRAADIDPSQDLCTGLKLQRPTMEGKFPPF